MVKTAILLMTVCAVACQAWADDGHWRSQILFECEHGMGGAAIGDLDPDSPGNEVARVNAANEPGVLIGGDPGKVTPAQKHDPQWSAKFIARNTGKIRGVAAVDADPHVFGAELYACGYSRNVTQFVRDQRGPWTPTVIFTAQRPLHHPVAGEFDPTHVVPKSVTCGHGGRLSALFGQ